VVQLWMFSNATDHSPYDILPVSDDDPKSAKPRVGVKRSTDLNAYTKKWNRKTKFDLQPQIESTVRKEQASKHKSKPTGTVRKGASGANTNQNQPSTERAPAGSRPSCVR